MAGLRKRFDTTLFALADEPARECIKKLLKDTEFNVIDNPKKRGVDLLVYKDGKHVANIECEIKLVWKGPKFPYSTIQFAERKEKYAIDKVPVVFCMFNADRTNHVTVTGDVLIASPKAEVPNKYVYKGEYFFQVPITKAKEDSLLQVLRGVV